MISGKPCTILEFRSRCSKRNQLWWSRSEKSAEALSSTFRMEYPNPSYYTSTVGMRRVYWVRRSVIETQGDRIASPGPNMTDKTNTTYTVIWPHLLNHDVPILPLYMFFCKGFRIFMIRCKRHMIFRMPILQITINTKSQLVKHQKGKWEANSNLRSRYYIPMPLPWIHQIVHNRQYFPTIFNA